MFRCQSCCYPHHDTIATSPYKKVEADRHFFDSTESSDEILDQRDFTELRNSFVTQQTEESEPTKLVKNTSPHKSVNFTTGLEQGVQNSTPIIKSEKPLNEGNCSKKFTDFVIVGNAETGFRLKQKTLDSKDFARNKETVLLPLPQASSTPGNVIKTEPLTEDAVVSTPRKVKRPRSPNTLVKNWVKKTQEMYESNDACLSNPTESVQIIAPANARQRNLLRMKSFSKKDRVAGSRPSFLRKAKTERSGCKRNSFREAFGFHVVDLDKISENSSSIQEAIALQATSVPSIIQANTIRNRIDKPPPPLSLRKNHLKNMKQKKETKCNNSSYLRQSDKTDASDEQQESSAEIFGQECDKENINNHETNSVKESDFPSSLNIQSMGSNKADQLRQPARKKLNFKPISQPSLISTRSHDNTFSEKQSGERPTTRHLLGSIENRC